MMVGIGFGSSGHDSGRLAVSGDAKRRESKKMDGDVAPVLGFLKPKIYKQMSQMGH